MPQRSRLRAVCAVMALTLVACGGDPNSRGDADASGQGANEAGAPDTFVPMDVVAPPDAVAPEASAPDAPPAMDVVTPPDVPVVEDASPPDVPGPEVEAPDAPADAPLDVPVDAPEDAPADAPADVFEAGPEASAPDAVDVSPPDAPAPTDVPTSDAPVTCDASTTSCLPGPVCVDLQTSVAHCGMCGNACPADPLHARAVCITGRCSIACDPGFLDCNRNQADGCEISIATDTRNCGTCNTVCPTPRSATPTCSAGTCGFACNAGFANCDGDGTNGCEVGTASDVNNCGTCGNRCPIRPANATAVCTSGMCGVVCNTGFCNSNGSAADGCEGSVGDPNNCTGCGNVCPTLPNTTPTCVRNICGGACLAGFANCDMNTSNGCETNTNTSNANCGGCGRPCRTGLTCRMGACAP